jgi:hypothetical protein
MGLVKKMHNVIKNNGNENAIIPVGILPFPCKIPVPA